MIFSCFIKSCHRHDYSSSSLQSQSVLMPMNVVQILADVGLVVLINSVATHVNANQIVKEILMTVLVVARPTIYHPQVNLWTLMNNSRNAMRYDAQKWSNNHVHSLRAATVIFFKNWNIFVLLPIVLTFSKINDGQNIIHIFV